MSRTHSKLLDNPVASYTGEGILVTSNSRHNRQSCLCTTGQPCYICCESIIWKNTMDLQCILRPRNSNPMGYRNVAGVLYAEGNVYLNEWYDIVCLNAVSGNVTWNLYLNRESDPPLSYYAGNLYDVTETFNVYVINAATGAKESYRPWQRTNTPVPIRWRPLCCVRQT